MSGRIDAGSSHSCAITADGALHCWGNGASGRLGYGNTTSIGDNEAPGSAGPVDLGSGRTATAVAVGNNHTCAIANDGTVHCWGVGTSGQLGYGNTETIGDNETPAAVGSVDLGGRNAVGITAGSNFTCALLDNGTVRCWGAAGSGQLGYGNTTAIGDNETPAAVSPVDLGVGRTAVAISSGTNHTCAILDNGTVRCWGSNSNGELGYGNTTFIGDTEAPGSVGPVDLGAGRTATAIAAGNGFTCALLDNGTVRCWGAAGSGQLGYGNTTAIGDNETPGTAGPVDLGSGRNAVAITAGSNHTCAVLDNGTMRCWGFNFNGQLGYGNTTTIGDNETPVSVAPIDLGGGRSAIAAAAGESHTCAWLENGAIRCWGVGTSGRLGYGNTTAIGDNEAPGSAGPVDLGSVRGVLQVVTGGFHTCALMENGSVRCWGSASGGRLGLGPSYPLTIGDNENPGSVPPVDLGPGRSAVQLAAAGSHTCALLDDGTVRCWGSGANGRLGYANIATIGDDETPGSVGPVNLGGRSAIAIAAGGSHTCAVLDDGSVRCWGAGENGRLGYGNTATIGDDETPGSVGPVVVGGSAIGITAGGFHTCAILSDHTLRCWGFNVTGQLGYGNSTAIGDNENPSAAGAVSIGRSAMGVTAGNGHTCAPLANGTARCWGANNVGQLGYGNTTYIGDNELPTTAGPLDLGAGRNAISIASATEHSCAVLDNGSVRCWGVGTSGELGYGVPINIGDNETPGTAGPVDLGAGRTALSVSAASDVSCAVLDNGMVRCWGVNSLGQLGYGDTKQIGDDEAPGSVGPVDLWDDVPVAVNDSDTFNEDPFSPRIIEVLANDTDVDGGQMTINSVTNGAHGTVAIINSGSRLNYSPEADYCGADSFTYTLNGGSTATVSVTIACVDDLPVAVNDSASLSEDAGASAIDVLANDTDADGGPKSVVSKANGGQGTVSITGGGSGVSYTPDANYCGPDAFTYTLNGGSSATVSVTIACVDDAPVAVNDSATLNEDASATAIDVLANDTDVDGGSKAVGSKTDAAHGTVAITGGGTGLTYQPEADFCGGDSFTYQLNGGSQATVSVAVVCVDDPPFAIEDSATVAEDASATAIDVLANDIDVDGGAKTITAKSDGPHGAVAITGGGSGLTYLPDANYCGPDFFTYTLNGGATGTVWITVSCVDDPPVAVNDLDSLPEDSSATAIGVLANDPDIDEGPKIIVAKTNGAHGAIAVTDEGAGLTYLPDPNYCGPDSFTYQLNGGSQATVSITVTCVDDPPGAVDDAATVAEDALATSIDVRANDSDIDGGPKSIESKADGAHGAVAITGGGSGLTYLPDANYCGPDSFTYVLNGGSQATVSVTVSCVDDPPTAVNDSAGMAEDAAATSIDVLANDTDIDGGPKTIAAKVNGAHGTVAIAGGGSEVTYLPDPNYCGPDSFTYTLSGGSQATVSITVTCVDDPAAAVNDSAMVAEDASATSIDVLANDTDVDGGGKTITAKSNGPHGVVAITGGGSGLTYQPAANYCGPDSFTYTLNGGSQATVSMTVTCVDDPPVAVGDSDTVLEDAPATAIDVLANDTDPDGGSKLIAARTNGSNGTVAIIGGGAGLTYAPAPDYCGPDSFTYTLNGGSQATVSITVTCVDEPASTGGGGGSGGGSTTIVQSSPGSSAPVVNITPGIGVVSGRRHPRVAVKGSFAFFTLTCKHSDKDCSGTVTVTANIPSVALGPAQKVTLVKGKFRIAAGRSVLVRAKLTKVGLEVLRKRSLRGVGARMGIV
ncbi:MAG TPA: Ig-like domain-containing protein, partial [Solirubrobacterales bacterium]|nr:Ig-like domain-containing protein [Solirubrobacterales bacterium]